MTRLRTKMLISNRIDGNADWRRFPVYVHNRDLMKIGVCVQRRTVTCIALTRCFFRHLAQRVTPVCGCPIDTNGFCLPDKFDSVLNAAK